MFGHGLPNGGVDRAGGESVRVEAWSADAGTVENGGRVVTLVRDRHELIIEAEGNDDFRGARQQRRDSHRSKIAYTAGAGQLDHLTAFRRPVNMRERQANHLASRIDMTYVIAEPCIDTKDRGCVDVCPVDCIYEGPDILYIHPDECIDCGACEPECPVTAIFPEEDVPEEWTSYTAKNREYFETGDERQVAQGRG